MRLLSSTLAILSLLVLSDMGRAQESGSQKTSEEAKKGGEPGWTAPKKRVFPESEIAKTCRTYEGKFVSYYSRVYKVEGCKRRELVGIKLEEIGRKKVRIVPVENDVIAQLSSGKDLESKKVSRDCRKLNGRYFISPGDSMYVMEACKLREFADFETYENHAKKNRRKRPILELSSDEFAVYQKGDVIPSILDEDYSRDRVVETEVDVIPLSEACRGLNGNYVAYFSRVYKIENCRKREVLDHSKLSKRRFLELRSEQWISIPDGKSL